MKKVVSSILSLMLIVSLFGGVMVFAAPKPAAKSVLYKDGTYDIKQKSVKFGYEEAVITIKGGKMTKVILKRLDDKQKEIDYSTWTGKKFPNLKQFRLDLAKAMLVKQSASVDTITGATDSTSGWIKDAKAALAKAKK